MAGGYKSPCRSGIKQNDQENDYYDSAIQELHKSKNKEFKNEIRTYKL